MTKLKPSYVVENEAGTKCQLHNCDNPITLRSGPGSKLCKHHQKQMTEGFARLDRPYTFDKECVCERCGYDPIKDNPYISSLSNPEEYKNAISACIDVDHIDGNHANNDPTNLQYLCKNCHSAKTIINGDNLNRY